MCESAKIDSGAAAHLFIWFSEKVSSASVLLVLGMGDMPSCVMIGETYAPRTVQPVRFKAARGRVRYLARDDHLPIAVLHSVVANNSDVPCLPCVFVVLHTSSADPNSSIGPSTRGT
jgi:hypothetical protein